MRTPEEQLVDASLDMGKALLLAGGANFAREGIQLFYPVEVGGIASGDAPGLDDLVAVRRACRDLNKGGNGKHTNLMHPIGVEDAGDGVLHPRHLATC